MADYKEQTIAGKSWQRCVRVVIENPYGGTPSINFVEEKALNIDGGITTNLCGNLTTSFNPTATFPAYDEDGVLIREITHAEAYGLLNALYMELARVRDEQEAVNQPEE